jgi:hypothetical protein
MIKKLLFSLVLLFASMSFQAQSIGIVGDFNGWGSDVVMTTTDNENYSLVAYTFSISGNVKFRQDGAWTNNWGAAGFPSGTAVADGANIPVPAGTYDVTFNLTTLAYNFTAVSSGFEDIGFIGLFNDWTASVAMFTSNGTDYSKTDYYFSADGVKFRTNNSWAVSWGGDTFPSGEAILNGNNIPLTPGFYNLAFNFAGLNYTFIQVPVSIIGPGAQGWDTDVQLVSTDGGINFSLNNITLNNGPVKFRANNSWSTNWGSNTFPAGTGAVDGQEIPVLAGTYNITFNRLTGEYNFATLSIADFKPSKAIVYPNPTNNIWNLSSNNNEVITNLQLIDVSGKIILNQNNASDTMSVDAASLTNGIYFAKIKTETGQQTIKLMKN